MAKIEEIKANLERQGKKIFYCVYCQRHLPLRLLAKLIKGKKRCLTCQSNVELRYKSK